MRSSMNLDWIGEFTILCKSARWFYMKILVDVVHSDV